MSIINDAKINKNNNAINEAAEYDGVDKRIIIDGLLDGTIVIPKNNNRKFKARAIGKGLTTKVNINLGVSEDNIDLNEN